MKLFNKETNNILKKEEEQQISGFLDIFFNEDLSNEDVLKYVNDKEFGIKYIEGIISTAVSETGTGMNPPCFNFGITLLSKRMRNVYVPLDISCLVNFSGEADLIGKSLLLLNFYDAINGIELPNSNEKFNKFVRIK